MPTPAMCRASRRLRSIPATPEAFDHDRAGAAYQAGGQAVQAVAAGVRDSGVQAGDTGLGVTPPLRGLCCRVDLPPEAFGLNPTRPTVRHRSTQPQPF
jgi:hypothetical protein